MTSGVGSINTGLGGFLGLADLLGLYDASNKEKRSTLKGSHTTLTAKRFSCSSFALNFIIYSELSNGNFLNEQNNGVRDSPYLKHNYNSEWESADGI